MRWMNQNHRKNSLVFPISIPFASCKTLSFKSCQIANKLRQAPATDWQSIFEKETNQAPAESPHDTNYALLKISLAQISAVNASEHPRFALVLGDFLAHNFRAQYILATHDRSLTGYQSFVKKTLQFLTSEIHQGLPDIDVYPALGNNDSYTGDYNVQPGGSFLRDTAATWAMLITNGDNLRALSATFPIAGFYAVNLPDKQKLLMLDTVLFSTAIKGQGVAQAAQLELKWLRTQLQVASQQQQSVLLAFHIPGGVNVYMTLLNIFHGVDEFWQHDVSKEFNNILKEYASTIKAILPGHIHMDSFQVVNLNDTHAVPVSYTPSISPIFGNNPGFKVYSYDKATLQLTDYDMYFYPLNEPSNTRQWHKEYSFNKVYHENCVACDLLTGMKNLTPSGNLANNYKQFYAVNTQTQPIIKNHYWLPYYWCNIFESRLDAYQTCIKH
jgi:sphingomyelin phosphodiesterase acid-like 3